MKPSPITAIVAALLAPLAILTAQEAPKLGIVEVTPMLGADFSDDRVLTGSSHNVFVAKVLEDLGSVALRGIPLPHTRFRVAVAANIKGTLEGEIFVDTAGGIKNGKLYVVRGVKPSERLQVGGTYLFCTRSDSENPERAHLVTRQPSGKDIISTDSARTLPELSELAAKSPRLQQMIEAYKNELIPEVFRDTARNSYPK